MAKKAKAPKNTKTGTSNLRALPKPPPAFKGDTILANPEPKLTPEQIEELRAHNANFLDARASLGALSFQYEAQKAQLLRAMSDQQKALSDKAKNFGTALGLDMEKENWTLDFNTGAYTKVDKIAK